MRPIALVAGLCWIAAATPAVAQKIELTDYVVQKGDTCAKISKTRYGNPKRYDLIHQFNPGMGPPPHRLVPGTVLRLPPKEIDSGPDAQVTQVVRKVQARSPKEEAWLNAQRGQDLFRGWRVNTLERANAEVTFSDTSAIRMGENTLVVIYGGSKERARRQTTRASLEKGRLLSKLGTLRMEVDTPGASATLSGGDAVVFVDETQTTRLSNLEGGAAKLTSGDVAGKVNVPSGFGSKVIRKKPPSKPKPLPPAPVWAPDLPRRFVGLVRSGGTLTGSWASVDVARRYRVAVSTEEDGRGIVVETEVPARINSFEIHRLPVGAYFVRVSTIGKDLFESKPSEVLPVEVARLGFELPGTDGAGVEFDVGDPSQDPAPPRLPLGAEIVPPSGTRCGLGGADPTPRVPLRAAGPARLDCLAEGDLVIPPLELEVVAPTVELLEGGARSLTRGQPAEVALGLENETGLPTGIEVRSDEGVELGALTAADGQYRVPVTAGPQAPDRVAVRLGVETSSGWAQLATAELEVIDPPAPPLPPPPVVLSAIRPLRPAHLDSPDLLSLRDRGWRQHGVVLGIGVTGNVSRNKRRAIRGILGVDVSPTDRLRVSVAHPFDVFPEASLSAGARGLRTGVGWKFIETRRLFLDADLGAWIPLDDDGESVPHVRLAPSGELVLRSEDNLYLRTRQGLLAGLGTNDLTSWASSYGVDVTVAGPFAVGLEMDLGVGSRAGGLDTPVGFGAAGSYAATNLVLVLGANVSLTDDRLRRFGRWSIAAAVRGRM